MQGSLRQVVNSKGEKVWRLQWRENGKGRTRILGRVREMGRAEAEAARRAIVEPLEAGSLPPRAAGLTLREYVERDYLPACSSHWKRSTELTTTSLIDTYILPALGDRLLAQIARRELQAHLDGLAAQGYSKSVVNHVRFQLVAIFRMAAGDRRIIGNPTGGLKTPRMAPPAKPTVGQEDAIAAAMIQLPVRERLFFALAVWRGLRPGEIVGLQLGDIAGDWIQIRRRIYRGTIDTPKSVQGIRDVPVGALAGLLAEYVETLPYRGKEAWLFPSETNKTAINANALYRKRLLPVLQAAGLTGFSFQAMRRTFATLFAQREPDPKVRAAVMGHGVDVHEAVYRQTTDEQKRRSIQRFEDRVQ